MRIKSLFILLLLGFSFPKTTDCQNWDAVDSGIGGIPLLINLYADTLEDILYVGGKIYNVGVSYDKLRSWNGSNWDTITSSVGASAIMSIIKYDNELYVGGDFQELSGLNINHIGRWDGISWDSLPTTTQDAVFTLSVYNNELYVGGIFDSIGTLRSPGIAKWDGTNWYDVGGGIPIASSTNAANSARIRSITFYNDKLYSAGTIIDSTLSLSNHLLMYDGISWSKVSGWQIGIVTFLQTVCVYKNELYVGGQFSKSDGYSLGNNIIKWNDTAWSEVGNGLNGTVRKLFAYNEYLYAVGDFDMAGELPSQYLAKWDGQRWCSVGSSSFDNKISDVAFWRDSLYIVGPFETIDDDSVNYIAKWNGDNSSDTCEIKTSIIENILPNNGEIKVYPNPSSDIIVFEIGVQNNKIYVVLFNVLGVEVRRISTIYSQAKIMRDELPSGLYFYKVASEFGVVGTGKIIID